MNSVKLTFRGLMTPVFTPFDENKKINFQIIPEYAKYIHSVGINGILVNGTTGEGVSLTTQERKEVLEKWVKVSKPLKQVIMVQVGGTNMEDVKELAKHAEDLEVSSILCLPDLFFRPNNVHDLVRYLQIVANAAPKTPLLYYHIPSFTGINISMKELLECGSIIPTFAGIKFTDNDLVMGSSCVSVGNNVFGVFLGNDTLLLPALLQGFDSAIGTTINIFPHANINIFRYFKEGNIVKALEEQKKLNFAIEKITQHNKLPWVSCMKKAMRELSPIEVGPVRDPLPEL